MARSELHAPPSAVWIGSAHPFDLHEAYLDFRRTFTLTHALPSATLFITADSRYRLWVNGTFIARGPARCWPHAQTVDALDLAPHLHAGPNTLAVQVYQPGYSHFAYVHRGAGGLLAWLTTEAAPLPPLVTDLHWRVRRNPTFNSLVPRVSIYGSGVEDRDLNLEEDWLALEFDDSTWATPRLVAAVGAYPWLTLHLRALPLLIERPQSMTLLEMRRGPTTQATDPHLAVRAGWSAAQRVAPVAGDWFDISAGRGESVYWLFDLGRDYQCQGWAVIEGATGGETMCVSYAEKMRDGELVLSDPDTYCRVRLTDYFHLRPGAQTAETFALRGGRYLLFQITGPTQLRVRFHARIAEYPLTRTRSLKLEDPTLAHIAAICEATVVACLADGFVDSVWRESSQWVGDALPQALTLASITDDVRPLRRVLVMAAEGAYPDDVLPSVLPGEVHAYAIVDYNFIWIELLALYHRLTQDVELVRDLWPTLTRLLERFHQDLSADGLIHSQPGRRLFLDWAPLSRHEPSAVYNLHYTLALHTAARLATDLELTADAENWSARADAHRMACRAVFWDGTIWKDDITGTTFSQLAAALAVLTQAAHSTEIPALLDAITSRSLDETDEPTPDRMVLASPFMHHYIFEALRAHRRHSAVLDIIRRRWGRWAKNGNPTTWENWNVDFPDGSQCHAFSAHPRYHLAEMLTI